MILETFRDNIVVRQSRSRMSRALSQTAPVSTRLRNRAARRGGMATGP